MSAPGYLVYWVMADSVAMIAAALFALSRALRGSRLAAGPARVDPASLGHHCWSGGSQWPSCWAGSVSMTPGPARCADHPIRQS